MLSGRQGTINWKSGRFPGERKGTRGFVNLAGLHFGFIGTPKEERTIKPRVSRQFCSSVVLSPSYSRTERSKTDFETTTFLFFQLYAHATLEVCGWKLGRYPQVQGNSFRVEEKNKSKLSQKLNQMFGHKRLRTAARAGDRPKIVDICTSAPT